MGKDFPYYALWRLLEPEVLSTVDAFNAYPADARRRHFIRRTKEEMVDFRGQAHLPDRVSDTLSYDLTQGEISEQTLYDKTTALHRPLLQPRSHPEPLGGPAGNVGLPAPPRELDLRPLRSFERRLEKLDGLIESIKAGKITVEQLTAMQRKLDETKDVFDDETGDEETPKAARKRTRSPSTRRWVASSPYHSPS